MNETKQDCLARKIRAQYTETQPTALDELKALDRRAKAPANVFAFTFGTLGALVMGAGMSLVMTDIGSVIALTEPMVPGLVIGLAGMAIAIVNPLIHRGILAGRRKKYAQRIIDLSDKVAGERGTETP